VARRAGEVGAGVRRAGAVPEAPLPALVQAGAVVHHRPRRVGHLGVRQRREPVGAAAAVGVAAAVERRGADAAVAAVPHRPRRRRPRREPGEAGAGGHLVGVAHPVGSARGHGVALVLGRVPVEPPRGGGLQPRPPLQQPTAADDAPRRAVERQPGDDAGVADLEAVGGLAPVVDEAEAEAHALVSDGVRDARELHAVPWPRPPHLGPAVPDEHLRVPRRVHRRHHGARRRVGRARPRRQRHVRPGREVHPEPHPGEQRVGGMVEPLPHHAPALVRHHQVAVVADPRRAAAARRRRGSGGPRGRRRRPHHRGVGVRDGERAFLAGYGERGAGVVRGGAADGGGAVGHPDDGADGHLGVPDPDIGVVGAQRGEEAEHEAAGAGGDERVVPPERLARRDGVPGAGSRGEKQNQQQRKSRGEAELVVGRHRGE